MTGLGSIASLIPGLMQTIAVSASLKSIPKNTTGF